MNRKFHDILSTLDILGMSYFFLDYISIVSFSWIRDGQKYIPRAIGPHNIDNKMLPHNYLSFFVDLGPFHYHQRGIIISKKKHIIFSFFNYYVNCISFSRKHNKTTLIWFHFSTSYFSNIIFKKNPNACINIMPSHHIYTTSIHVSVNTHYYIIMYFFKNLFTWRKFNEIPDFWYMYYLLHSWNTLYHTYVYVLQSVQKKKIISFTC